MKKLLLIIAISFFSMAGFSQSSGSYQTVKNVDGPVLGYSSESGVQIVTEDGFKFKDLNKNGILDKYEDWRLPIDERAKDLAEQIGRAHV